MSYIKKRKKKQEPLTRNHQSMRYKVNVTLMQSPSIHAVNNQATCMLFDSDDYDLVSN